MARIFGYGAGWSEPLAVGRWNRFRQKMREPMTKTDVWFGFVAIPLFALVIALALRL